MKKKILNSLCLATIISFTMLKVPITLHAESPVQEEIVMEESGFDDNAHGEVKLDGVACEPKYRLYEDGTLYIYGNGIRKNRRKPLRNLRRNIEKSRGNS